MVVLLSALMAGPAAWAAQLILGYGLASAACFPDNAPQQSAPPPGWTFEPGLLLAINLICLAGAVVGVIAAGATWRGLAGEGEARSRFLAACAVLSGVGFAVAILFDTVPILGVPSCWSIAA